MLETDAEMPAVPGRIRTGRALGALAMKCGIKHGFHDGTCIREKGHEGFCRCKAERGGGGTITYSEWVSKNGKFHRHHQYKTIYPKNASKEL